MKKNKSISEIFKEKFEKSLIRIEKKKLKIHGIPSIWDIKQKDLNSFLKEADEILTVVSSMCLKEGLKLHVGINAFPSEDWSLVSLVESELTMYDYDKESDIITADFYSFMNLIYKLCNIPIVLLLFSCIKLDIDLELKTIVITSDT